MADCSSRLDVPDVRVYVGDSAGRIKVLYTRTKQYETLHVPGCKHGAALACQALACAPQDAATLVRRTDLTLSSLLLRARMPRSI